VWHIPFSISIAGSTRIGNLVGSGLTRLTTLRIMTWYFFVFLTSALLNVAFGCGVVVFMLKYLIHDEDVAGIVSENLVWMLVFVFWLVSSRKPLLSHCMLMSFPGMQWLFGLILSYVALAGRILPHASPCVSVTYMPSPWLCS
jgi:hypothetical protein